MLVEFLTRFPRLVGLDVSGLKLKSGILDAGSHTGAPAGEDPYNILSVTHGSPC